MSTVAIAIVVCLAGYTWMRLKYAKPGHGHEPFAQAFQRRESEKLKAAGWERFEAAWERAVDFPDPRGNVRVADARSPLSEDLFKSSTENWHLPIEYLKVTAPAELAAAGSYTVYLQALVDQARVQVHSFDIYRKGSDVLIIPRWEQIPEELIPRDAKTSGRMLWPEGKLPPGRYRVRLLALKQASEWDLTVVP